MPQAIRGPEQTSHSLLRPFNSSYAGLYLVKVLPVIYVRRVTLRGNMPVRIRDIMIPVDPLAPAMRVGAALQRFISEPGLNSLPVVTDGVPLGLVSRAGLMEACLTADSSDSAMSLPITRLMTLNPAIAELEAPAAYIAKKIGDATGSQGFDGVIAIEAGRYAGCVPADILLSVVADENAQRAKSMKARAGELRAEKEKHVTSKQEQLQLLSFLGHEIRTPLTGILGVADLLEDTNIDGEAREFAQTIADSGRHLDRILGDFLDLTRLEVGKLTISPAPLKLTDLASEARNLWAGRSRKSNISLKITTDDTAASRIEADGTRLRQILFNLIGNAVKFTEAGSVSAHLETKASQAGAVRLVMTVTDTGVGISTSDKARLFQAFEQANVQTVHRYGGTGLGLTIAKGLVDRMGGKITLRDNPEGGSIFQVICPVRRAGPRLAVENKRRKASNFQLGRIMLLEDHAVSRMVITRALNAVGWSIDHVTSVEQAKRRATSVPYQALLLDLHLQDGSGLDVIKAIRSSSGPNQDKPVLAVTADVSQSQKNICAEAGFTSFVSKPIRPRDLVATLADAIMASDAVVSGKSKREAG